MQHSKFSRKPGNTWQFFFKSRQQKQLIKNWQTTKEIQQLNQAECHCSMTKD